MEKMNTANDKNELVKKLKNAIMDADYYSTPRITQEALEAGVEHNVLMKGISEAIRKLENVFKGQKVYLHPFVFMSMEAVRRSLAVLEPLIEDEGKSLGTVVLGVPEGDTHDIGAKMLTLALTAAGFKVVYLGHDVTPGRFINKLIESDAQILAVSIYQTSGFKKLERIMELLSEAKIRDQVKVMVGGVSVTEKLAGKFNVGYAKTATDAVKLAQIYLGEG